MAIHSFFYKYKRLCHLINVNNLNSPLFLLYMETVFQDILSTSYDIFLDEVMKNENEIQNSGNNAWFAITLRLGTCIHYNSDINLGQ